MGKLTVILGCLTLAASAVHAQFNFTTNNGTLTIIAYTGSGGNVTIPSTTNGLAIASIGTNSFENIPSLTHCWPAIKCLNQTSSDSGQLPFLERFSQVALPEGFVQMAAG